MRVRICSLLHGRSFGFVTYKVSHKISLGEIVNLFYLEKGIKSSRGYDVEDERHHILDQSKSIGELRLTDGDSIFITNSDNNNDLFVNKLKMIFLSLVVSLGLIYSSCSPNFDQKIAFRYGLVIDAGSTHSELFVFSWKNVPPNIEPQVELIHNCIMYGGVAEFRSHVEDLFHYFNTCLSEAHSIIPRAQVPSTPLILAATAGMRILRAYDPKGAELVLSSVRKILQTSTKFKIGHHDVFVASGQQEGINGWTAINYLMNTFQERVTTYSPASALDLGGASVQVTTQVEDFIVWPSVNVTFFNNTYTVYSKSLLCYGIGEAMHRHQFLLIENLIRNKSSQTVAHNPCISKGFNMTFTACDFRNPCIFSNKSSFLSNGSLPEVSKYIKRFNRKYMGSTSMFHSDKPEDEKDVLYRLEGRSDPIGCRESVRRLFNYSLCRENFIFGDCLKQDSVPPYTGELVGFSTIFRKLFSLLGVSYKENSTLAAFEEAVHLTCSLKADDITKLHGNVSMDMLQDLCFDAMYVYILLTEGIGITPQKWQNILFTNKIRQQEIVWALGLILNRSTLLPVADNTGHKHKHKHSSYHSFLLPFSLVMFSYLLFWWCITYY